jgi:sugar lactone lactonase YvrE
MNGRGRGASDEWRAADGPAAVVRVAVPARAGLGEGPVWDAATERLIWVDIVGKEVHFYDPRSGHDTSVDVEQTPGVAMPRAGGGLVLAIGHGFGFLDPEGRFEWIEQLPQGRVQARMNDGNCDSAGRFWAGTTGLATEPDGGVLYRLDPDLTVTRMLDGVTESNGIDWSPDDALMYYVDSLERRVDVFDFDLESGSLANRRPFAAVGEGAVVPDGLTVDADGYVWTAIWGGSELRRFAPDGSQERVIALPTRQITSCAFGGAGLRDLYVTSAREWLDPEILEREPDAGAVFVCAPGMTGRPQRTFAG